MAVFQLGEGQFPPLKNNLEHRSLPGQRRACPSGRAAGVASRPEGAPPEGSAPRHPDRARRLSARRGWRSRRPLSWSASSMPGVFWVGLASLQAFGRSCSRRPRKRSVRRRSSRLTSANASCSSYCERTPWSGSWDRSWGDGGAGRRLSEPAPPRHVAPPAARARRGRVRGPGPCGARSGGFVLRTSHRSPRAARWRNSAGSSTTCRLALELAAARTKVLTPLEQILERLAQRLNLLKGGRDADPRQEDFAGDDRVERRPAR